MEEPDGFVAFFEENPSLWQSHLLHDTKVIVDGTDFLSYLHQKPMLSGMCGDKYARFAASIREIFRMFKVCAITPIIFFPGGIRKTDVRKKRGRFEMDEKISMSGSNAEHPDSTAILPTFAFEVFKDVMKEMQISIETNYLGERQVASLAGIARSYKCPIISQNTDYFIVNVEHGFIHTKTIEFHASAIKDSAELVDYLPCKIFYQKYFLSAYPGEVDVSLMPLFGAMLRDNFIQNILYLDEPGYEMIPSHAVVAWLLSWLESKTENEALGLLLKLLKDEDKGECVEPLNRTISNYKERKIDDLSHSVQRADEWKFGCGQALPSWLVLKLKNENFPFFLSTIVSHRVSLPLQYKISDSESTHRCSLRIREALYGVLLRHKDRDGNECRSGRCSHFLTEHSQNAVRPTIRRVQCSAYLRNTYFRLPTVDEIAYISPLQSCHILETVLGEDFEAFSEVVPRGLKLIMASMRYWLRVTKRKCLQYLVAALVLSFIYTFFVKVFDRYAGAYGSIPTIIRDDVAKARERFTVFLLEPDAPREWVCVNFLHSLSEFKSCLLYAMHLNKILGCPLDSPRFHESYDGVLICNLAVVPMVRYAIIDEFASEILGVGSPLFTYFKKLIAIAITNIVIK